MRVKLRRLDAWTARRAEIASIYNEGLADTCVTPPPLAEGVETTWHQYSVRCPHRSELGPWLKESGIDSMIYYPVPLHFHAPYARFGRGEGSLPVTEKTSREILNLPMHPHLTDAQAQEVVARIRAFADR